MGRTLNTLLIPFLAISLSGCIPLTIAYFANKHYNKEEIETANTNKEYCPEKTPEIYCVKK